MPIIRELGGDVVQGPSLGLTEASAPGEQSEHRHGARVGLQPVGLAEPDGSLGDILELPCGRERTRTRGIAPRVAGGRVRLRQILQRQIGGDVRRRSV